MEIFKIIIFIILLLQVISKRFIIVFKDKHSLEKAKNFIEEKSLNENVNYLESLFMMIVNDDTETYKLLSSDPYLQHMIQSIEEDGEVHILQKENKEQADCFNIK